MNVMDMDFTKLELRIAAMPHKDWHVQTATEIFGVSADGVTPDMRRFAKLVNFWSMYSPTGRTPHAD